MSLRSALTKGSGPNRGSAGKVGGEDVKQFIVERCESEFDTVYKTVMKTSTGQATLNHLSPGQSYRFRVYSINMDGVSGPKSQDVIVHTLLETPALPTALTKNIFPRKIILSWPRRNTAGSNPRDKAFVDRMLGDWAQNHGEQDGGVSIEAAFAKYDKDCSGSIDASEFHVMLTDLGVEVSEERLREAFAVLDCNGDGIIDFAEFSQWWRRDDVTYVVKRSEEVLAQTVIGAGGAGRSTGNAEPINAWGPSGRGPKVGMGRMSTIVEEEHSLGSESLARAGSRRQTRPKSAGAAHRGKNGAATGTGASASGRRAVARQVGVPIVSYRDSKNRCEVAGLNPNRLYHFRLRYIGSRSNSLLSPPLMLMTVPAAPSCPILVDITSGSVRVKWYPGEFGAFKFHVQLRQDDEWSTVYNGQETVWTHTALASDTRYSVRILAANCQGNLSEPSKALTFNTLRRGVEKQDGVINSRTVNSVFRVECTGDICVGDVILITERLYEKPSTEAESSIVGGRSKLGGGGSQTGVPRINVSMHSDGGSVHSTYTGGGGGSMHGGDACTVTGGDYKKFIGDRCIACHVAKDNYRSTKAILASAPITEANRQRFWTMWLQGRRLDAKQFWTRQDGDGHKKGDKSNVWLCRTLWLEVVWQRASPSMKTYKKFELRPGEVLERQQQDLEQFEVFRSEWMQEQSRLNLPQEYASLDDCFVAVDC